MKNEARQLELLKAIHDWQESHEGQSPTFAELATVIGVTPPAVWIGIQKLRDDGRIIRTPGRWRSLEITDPEFVNMTRAQMQAEIKRLTAERDELARRLAQLLERGKK